MADKNSGSISVEPRKCRTAEYGTWEITFTVGGREIPAGGRIRFLLPSYWSYPQQDDPDGAGFSSVVCPASVKTEIEIQENSVYAEVKEGRLVEGDEAILIYGDRSEGSHGARSLPVPTETAPEGALFHVSVAFPGEEAVFIDPPGRIEISSSPATRILVAVPSRLTVHEEAPVRLTAVDNFANLDSRFKGEVIFSDKTGGIRETITLSEADKGKKNLCIRFERPGVYLPRAECPEKGVSGMSNPVNVEPEPGEFNLYWGDIHVHSRLSDALGTPETGYAYAREVAGLDFAAVADHDWVYNTLKRDPHHAIDEEGWEYLKKVNDEYYRPGEFVTLLGYEWIRQEKPGSSFGHMNVYYRGNDGPLFLPGRTKSANAREISALLEEEEGVLFIPHQSLYSSPDLLEHPVKSTKMRLVEIYSGWGNSEAGDGLLINDYVRRNILKRERKGESVQQYLAAGYRLGFFSSSDTHFTSPGRMPAERIAYMPPTSHRGGLAAVYAKELTREAIFDALWERRCYAVTGARIILEFSVNGHFMGSEIKDSEGAREIRGKVIAAESVEKMELIKNNNVIRSWERPGMVCDLEYRDERAEHEVDYYYLRVIQTDGEMAWSSPVWVENR